MSGVAEKARFFLERAVPQLREWEEKEIFSKDEIRNIVQKRNTFEHQVLSPGNRPSDWAAYARWERQLEDLRSKRCRRLRIRHLESAHQGQGRVLAVYERGANRHPGSAALWKEYLNYTSSVKATKRFRRTMTNALRMLPTECDLWITAGRRSAENGDMAAARGFFMRGCRFCNREAKLWVEYARSEMQWLQKMERKKSHGKSGSNDPLRSEQTERDDFLEIAAASDEEEEDDNDDSMNGGVLLPEPSQAQEKIIDKQDAKRLSTSNPALSGAIPKAIFDISRKQPFFDVDAGASFFDMFTHFPDLAVQASLVEHVLVAMEELEATHPATWDCRIRQPLIGVDPATTAFPKALREVLPRLAEGLETTSDRADLAKRSEAWIDRYLGLEGLDGNLRLVLENAKASLNTAS